MPAVSNLKDTTATGQTSTSSTAKLLDTINHLQQEVAKSKEEALQVSNQLSCLISLVKRSWMGDKIASYHVANVIGIPIPKDIDNISSPFVDSKTKAIMNWERFTLRLLDQEYKAVQEELRGKQQEYINYRENYMDDILNNHQQKMSQLSLHKNSSTIHDVDNKFVKTYQQKSRPPTGKGARKCPSATKRPGKVAEDMVERIEIGVHDLLLNSENSNLSNSNGVMHRNGLSPQFKPRRNSSYDDSSRYTKANLFNTEDVLGRDAFLTKKRPVSASLLREKDKLRSRPKSATIGIPVKKIERPLKYEVVKPEKEKKSLGDRHGSLDTSLLQEQQKAKAELQLRIQSATKRPDTIDKFVEDMKNMTEMETKFKQSTVNLQRKLGIDESGFI